MFSVIIFENSISALLIVLCVVLALGVTGYAFKCYLGFNKLHTGLLIIRILCLLLIAWCLFLPTQRQTRTELLKPSFLVALDTSASMKHSPSETDEENRFTKALNLLKNDDVLETLNSKFNVDFAVFDAGFEAGLRRKDIVRKKTEGKSTYLRSTLQKIRRQYRGRELAGVLLLSDGLDTQNLNNKWAVRDWAFPIYPVMLEQKGIWKEKPELSVTSVDTPRRVQPGWESTLTAVINGKGLNKEAVNVRLIRNDELIDKAPVQIPENGGNTEVTFRIQHKIPGNYIYKVVAPELPEEVNKQDNSRAVNVTVISAKNRVLYLEGNPRWESKYLIRMLEQSDNITPSAFLRYAGTKFLTLGSGGHKEALSLTDSLLDTFAIVILGDVSADTLQNGRDERLVKFVKNGGSLILLGGKTAWGKAGFDSTELKQVLPFNRPGQEPPLEGKFQLTLTSEGRTHPVFGSGNENWRNLPPVLSVFPTNDIAPAALVLLETQTSEGSYPVIISQKYGEGKVVSLLTSSFWRWQLSPSAGTPYKRFWSQMFEWLLPEKQEFEKYEFELFADKEQLYSGDDIMLKARFNEMEETKNNLQDITCQVQTPNGRELEFNMNSQSITTRDGNIFPGFATTYSPTDAGTYKAVARTKIDGDQIESEPYYFVVKEYSPEKSPKPFNFELMQTLAAQSGGVFIEAGQTKQSFADLQAENQREKHVEYSSLWNRLPLLITIIALLCAEWIIRKRKMIT